MPVETHHRALVTSCGNLVLSTPNGPQLETALANPDFRASIGICLNETTRHARCILPPAIGLETVHYDVSFHALAIRNTSRYSEPLFDKGPAVRSSAPARQPAHGCSTHQPGRPAFFADLGRARCTLHINSADAAAHQLIDDQSVRLCSCVGAVELPVEITATVMPGVVCLPHGYGHHRPGTRQDVAQAHAGVSINDLTNDSRLDELTGNAALSGVSVWLEKLETGLI